MLRREECRLSDVADAMRKYGASRVVFKLLSNNDNSKQQIYFGSDFEVVRLIPHGELTGSLAGSKGAAFKAPVRLYWLPSDLIGSPAPARGSQLILYPKYPEVRLSGFLRGCPHAPNHLMKPPSAAERLARAGHNRCLILGLCPHDGKVFAFVSPWQSTLSQEAAYLIEAGAENVASIFYEFRTYKTDKKSQLLEKLQTVYQRGSIESCRLDASGNVIPYSASNGAGYTLESLLGIIPNGSSDPDFLGWEIKAHTGTTVTLMTPEPDRGSYLEDLSAFLQAYGRSTDTRRDFTGRLCNRQHSRTSGLTLHMEGYDAISGQITDPTEGGLMLRDSDGALAAGWSFNKLVTHWSKKHGQTAYVSYRRTACLPCNSYQFGPSVRLCEGADLNRFLTALHSGIVYYDPGINQKWNGTAWVAKKRNQFRASWSNVSALYIKVEEVDLALHQQLS